MTTGIQITRHESYCSGHFSAMNGPCELLFNTLDADLAKKLTQAAAGEVWRIQNKYSRYDRRSLCTQINQSQGHPVAIDAETYQLLNFAQQCYQISNGLFDITSGVLGKAWHFDGSDKLPCPEFIASLLTQMGWHKVRFNRHQIILPEDMALDFGGIGKEYAVDKVVQQLNKLAPGMSILVNFGGDLAITCAKPHHQSWRIGIENPNRQNQAKAAITIKQGALATSGDANRYLVKDGIRYSHILNPKTGWPIADAPRSVTVAAPQCVSAGMLSTIAILQGKDAEAFLEAQEVEYWCFR